MGHYTAPLRDIEFTLHHIAGLPELAALEDFSDTTPDIVAAVLAEIGKLASTVIAPLNEQGDRLGSVLENGVVRTPPGFAEAYAAFVAGGWNGLSFSPEYGGQGLPFTLSVSMMEMVTAANMGFALCPMLNLGGIEALAAHGSDALKAAYLEKMASGEWTTTMNLTEPQAGSDVGALKTRAVPAGDGSYRIQGQKIFITWGDHDMTDNIVHMVLARTPDAPPGTRGVSLFLVPGKVLREDGSLGPVNDLRCVSLEHKLGIHASPTAVMSYGDNDGCIGYLLGEENSGMRCMFTMMNHARLNVGLQGVAIAERAFQAAADYARERVQGRVIGAGGPGPWPIAEHADVRRMLMEMKALIAAGRALVHRNAVAVDLARHHPDGDERKKQAGIAAFLTPISKAWSTDMGCEVASLGIQVHGGMGYIEETGAAQYWRDASIAQIYEGTNGIQAQDLVLRKLTLDDGAPLGHVRAEIGATIDALAAVPEFADMAGALEAGRDDFTAAADWLGQRLETHPRACAAAADPYLRLAGLVIGAHLLARGALAAEKEKAAGAGDAAFLDGQITLARYFCRHRLCQTGAFLANVREGDDLLFDIPADHLSV